MSPNEFFVILAICGIPVFFLLKWFFNILEGGEKRDPLGQSIATIQKHLETIESLKEYISKQDIEHKNILEHQERIMANQRNGYEIKLKESIDYLTKDITDRNNKLVEQVNKEVSKNQTLSAEVHALSNKLEKAEKENIFAQRRSLKYKTFIKNVLFKMKSDNATLPSVIRWAMNMQQVIEQNSYKWLIEKSRPAFTAYEKVQNTKAEVRKWKQIALTYENKIDLYESQAPWLVETLNFSVEEIEEGMRIEAQEKNDLLQKDDTVKNYISSHEYQKLSPCQRNQLALDRYFSLRQKSAWLAGAAYERFIGFLYEKEGFSVVYQGIKEGKNDLGIDLVCHKNNTFIIIQCKRWSVHKQIPIRENAIAQIYGASRYFAYTRKIDIRQVTPMLVTSYKLSDCAREFADMLGVGYKENLHLDKYPCIKCNISRTNKEKIYHLPFDSAYDNTIIEKNKGEFWAFTCEEAESKGFRRAFKHKAR
jgi:Holliday junction resolvase